MQHGLLLEDDVQEEAQVIEARLSEEEHAAYSDFESNGDMALLNHRLAFVSAARIYLARELFDSMPADLQGLVHSVFAHAVGYRQSGGKSFQLWPAFIAAVEATEPAEKAMASEWFSVSSSVVFHCPSTDVVIAHRTIRDFQSHRCQERRPGSMASAR